MNYAITIDHSGRITARHESISVISEETFSNSPTFAGQEVRPISETSEYAAGFLLAEFDAQGNLRPLIDRITEGLAEVPPDMELINGELVPKDVTPEEAPTTMRQLLINTQQELQAAQATLHTQEAQINALITEAEMQADVMQELILAALQ